MRREVFGGGGCGGWQCDSVYEIYLLAEEEVLVLAVCEVEVEG